MKRLYKIAGIICLSLSLGTTTFANLSPYLNEDEYNDILRDNFNEDQGIVVENDPQLGYIVYKNNSGRTVTKNYFREEITVEKQPYYESEDRLGYLDELFPNFRFDPRDTTIDAIKAGDNIYIRTNKDDYVTYISAYNDYIMRYGKVNAFTFNTAETANLLLEDDKGRIYSYDVQLNTPVTKGGTLYTISKIRPGDWIKVLVAQKILGEGVVDEELKEIVIDNDSRYISNIYRGQIAGINTFKNLLNLKDTRTFVKAGWSAYTSLKAISVDPKKAESYLIGNPVSLDYVARYLRNGDNYVYVAAENHMGKENAVKLNFQSKLQRTLPPTTVTYSSPGVVRLLSGETIHIAKDAIIVRDKRLIESHNIMVGDVMQAVITGENKLAIASITTDLTTGSLQIFRGRIKKINDREDFEVESFSKLEGNTWYFHPTPQTFSIDKQTKFYTAEGFVAGGIETFLSYGENSQVGEVYTVVAVGEKAYAVINMPYTRESLKGEVYEVSADSIKVKDVYYYHISQKKWMEYSRRNTGATLTVTPNTVIIKNGKVIPATSLEKGDKVKAMLEVNLKETDGSAESYIIIVEG
ncbi:hypothetical protein [Cellulosilyticum sp. I15G10I2]|uniref:hypothetical protein n=1 Tax=Cellulosilyticum sp. I15G10I2 TaxID=1892843 RepID=UPI00085C75DC|nr:hypothetical protein [Cellulosilyticum sp. I15G10I2]